MGVLSVFWSALSQPNPTGYRRAAPAPVVDLDAVRGSLEAEALEAVLAEVSPEQVVERAAEKFIAQIPDRAAFQRQIAHRVAELHRISASDRKKFRVQTSKEKGGVNEI